MPKIEDTIFVAVHPRGDFILSTACFMERFTIDFLIKNQGDCWTMEQLQAEGFRIVRAKLMEI